jgi:hypothetical protein
VGALKASHCEYAFAGASAAGVLVKGRDQVLVDGRSLTRLSVGRLPARWTYKQLSTEAIPNGDVTVKMLFEIDEPRPGAGGNVTLWANDKQIGEGVMPHTPWPCCSRPIPAWTWAATTGGDGT